MSPERSRQIGNKIVEEFYWNGKLVVYINNHKVGLTFLEACDSVTEETL